MRIYNIIQSILNSNSTLKYKVLCIIYYFKNTAKEYQCIYYTIKNTLKDIMYISHSTIILLIKKTSIRWGIMAKSYLKSTSDNMYYVNLIPKQHDSYSKVVDCPYFARLLRKITRWGGILGGPTSRLSKNTKTLISEHIWEKKTKKGLDVDSGLCKLVFQNGGIIKNGKLGLFGRYELHDLWLPLSLLEDLINA